MQLSMQTARHNSLAGKAFRPARASRAAVRCQAGAHDMVKKIAKNAALAAAAGLLLVQPLGAEARVAEPTQFEKSRAQEEELRRILASRGGSGVQQVLESPKVKVEEAKPEPSTPAPLSLGEVTKVEAPAAPAPAPAPVAEAPKPEPVVLVPEVVGVKEEEGKVEAEVVVAPVPASIVEAEAVLEGAEDAVDTTLLLGAGATVALVAIGALGSQGAAGEQQPEAAASGAPAAGAVSDVAPNVAEARAWIAAWKKKQGK